MWQWAIKMLPGSVYEQHFFDCSSGFRSYRSVRQALPEIRSALVTQGLRWVVDVDISKYFDTIDHGHLRSFIDQRVTDT